jgi:hypothetical protein
VIKQQPRGIKRHGGQAKLWAPVHPADPVRKEIDGACHKSDDATAPLLFEAGFSAELICVDEKLASQFAVVIA